MSFYRKKNLLIFLTNNIGTNNNKYLGLFIQKLINKKFKKFHFKIVWKK